MSAGWPIASVVDFEALAETAVASLLGGVTLVIAFSLAIYGISRYAELRRSGRGAAALGAGAVGLLGLLASAAVVVAGIVVMIAL